MPIKLSLGMCLLVYISKTALVKQVSFTLLFATLGSLNPFVLRKNTVTFSLTVLFK